MKIIKDSGVSHWLHQKQITCKRCNSVYQTENDSDIEYDSLLGYAETVCPKCGTHNKTHKPWDTKTKVSLDKDFDKVFKDFDKMFDGIVSDTEGYLPPMNGPWSSVIKRTITRTK